MGGKVLVCNFTRLGDLLQSQTLIDDLRLAGHQTGLLCLENFSSALGLMRGLDYAATLPGARLLAGLDSGWTRSLTDLYSLAEAIRRDFNPDYIVNLTPTAPARLVCRLIAGSRAKILGFGIDEFGYGVNEGPWASFFATAARKRGNAPFNVADMARRLAGRLIGPSRGDGALRPPDAEARRWAASFLAAKPVEGATGFVAFQLGASEERRRWPAENFAALGDLLWREKKIVPVLLGSGGEAALARKYAEVAAHPFVNAVGATDLPRLAAILLETRLLVTNDTGTMHLASGLGVKSLAFFLATAQPWDTAPQLPGCCCLEPALDCHPCAFGSVCGRAEICRRRIAPDAVAGLILPWLETGDWSVGAARAGEQARVWLTERGEDGLCRVRRLAGDNKLERSVWMLWLRQFWSQLLDDLETGRASSSVDSYAALPHPPRLPGVADALRGAATALTSARECGLLAAKNSKAGELFLRNCERAGAIFEACESLATLAAYWREYRQSQGDSLAKILSAVALIARSAETLADALDARPEV